jgi:hypothetical protein
VPIPFRDAESTGSDRHAAYLRLVPDETGRELQGALLIVTSIGEPVELTWAELRAPVAVLCSDRRPGSHAARMVAVALFEKCQTTPHLLLYREDEIPADLFEHRLRMGLPVVAVSGDGASATWRWSSEVLDDGAPADALMKKLVASDLLVEPFARAVAALHLVRQTRDAIP